MLTSNIAGVENGVNKESFSTRFVFAFICQSTNLTDGTSPIEGALMGYLQCHRKQRAFYCVPVQYLLVQTCKYTVLFSIMVQCCVRSLTFITVFQKKDCLTCFKFCNDVTNLSS